ncbi:hypothetical protein [Bacillus infantis]|uniref:hypothetical protein n=1 Tax=Bacillus infantis TaxID=324767 RepID=UPI003CEE81CA
MSMYKNIRDIVSVFRNDETLLRLMHYLPEDQYSNRPDPLDKSLENILDIDEDWAIRDKVLKLVPKTEELEDEPLCRIYLYAGKRDRDENYAMANQQIIVDILCHSEYEQDLRSMRIGDRVNELLVHSRVTGIGKVDYLQGAPFPVPNNYIGYRHIYTFGSLKR